MDDEDSRKRNGLFSGGREGDRLTVRLEAFSDLVFGFSLSLLATRLDVPARAEDVFESTRWLAVGTTFALICRFWYEHYRVFRHHFVARTFDLVINFIFLFAIAILPYAVQTYLRFEVSLTPLSLYLGDIALILLMLSLLRLRGLRQRRFDASDPSRLADWRRSVLQIAGALLALVALIGLRRAGSDFRDEVRRFGLALGPAIAALLLFSRFALRKLPAIFEAPKVNQ